MFKEKFKGAFEKHRSGRIAYIWKLRQEMNMDREIFDQELKKLTVGQVIQTIGGDPSIMSEQEIKDSYLDSNNNLHIAIRWIEQPEQPKQQQSPVDFLLDNLDVVRSICAEYSTHAERWQDLKERLPGVETAMSLNTFKQLTPVILAVIQKLDNKPEPVKPPRKFMGWNIHQDNRGFIRMVRRVDGKKLKSVYVGKAWSEQKARDRIRKVTESSV